MESLPVTRQLTLQSPVSCTGTGLHNGEAVTMTFRPAKAGRGIVFRRMDVETKRALIPARFDLVTDTRLSTTLTNRHGTSVSTIEHVMAALWGAGVDNVIVELSGPEAPIMDGSSAPFAEMIERAGLRRLDEARQVIRVLKPVHYEEGKSVASIEPMQGGMLLDVSIDYDHAAIPAARGIYDFRTLDFAEALSNARTFGFAREVEYLRSQGLARGGSLQNAVVIGDNGVLNEEGLRSHDEFLRHKALDCVGDLALAGYRIEGLFTFLRPGHGVNNRLLRALMADKSAWKLVSTAAPRVSAQAEIQAHAFL